MRHMTKREAEALAINGQIPDAAGCLVSMAQCVGAVGAFQAVELADNGTDAGIQLPAGEGNRCVGITTKAGAIGDYVPVVTHGLAFGTLGGTLTAPDALQAAVTGKLIAAATADVVAAELIQDGADTEVKQVMVYGLAGYIHA